MNEAMALAILLPKISCILPLMDILQVLVIVITLELDIGG